MRGWVYLKAMRVCGSCAQTFIGTPREATRARARDAFRVASYRE